MPEMDIEKPKHRNQHPPAVTKAKQRAFLEHLIQCGRVPLACKLAKIAENTPYQWAVRSEDFAKRFSAAKIHGEKVLLSAYEEQMDSVCLEQAVSMDDYARTQNSRFFRMKRLDPAYRDNAPTGLTINGPVAVQINYTSKQPAQAETQVDEK